MFVVLVFFFINRPLGLGFSWKPYRDSKIVVCLKRLGMRNGLIWHLSCPGSSPFHKLFLKLISSLLNYRQPKKCGPGPTNSLGKEFHHFLFPASDRATPSSATNQPGSSSSFSPLYALPDSLPEALGLPPATSLSFIEIHAISYLFVEGYTVMTTPCTDCEMTSTVTLGRKAITSQLLLRPCSEGTQELLSQQPSDGPYSTMNCHGYVVH